MKRVGALLIAACALALPAGAQAAGPPQALSTWVTDVTASSAEVHAQVDPEGLATTFRFQYLPELAYEANLGAGREAFAGATSLPPAGGSAGSATSPQNILAHLSGLPPTSAYRYRVLVENSAGSVSGQSFRLETEESAPVFSLPDSRGWEFVSPIDKNGGTIEAPGQILGGGLLQAGAQGGSISYSSSSSFASPQAAPAASQYLSARGPAAWSTANISAPQASGAEPRSGEGVPYRAFSSDLDEGLIYAGGDCAGPHRGCADPSPPPPGSGAPAGYQDYYLRSEATGAYSALITSANASLGLSAEAFEVALAGASPDLRHILLSTCAALTAGATEVAEGEGCDPADPNLYEWSEGSLSLVNRIAGVRARPAAPAGAISADGSRVYWEDPSDGELWLSETGAAPRAVAAGASFQAASADGGLAFYLAGGRLERYAAVAAASTSVSSGVEGVLGASADGAVVYFQAATGLYRWDDGALEQIAPGGGVAEEADWPPATGTSRVSLDGSTLVFASPSTPTGFADVDATSGLPDSELYVYEAGPGLLTCASCDPTGERPAGSSSMPGALVNGEGALGTSLYRPRALAAGGTRLFFDSEDHLVLQDTNSRSDVYEWEAPGTGTCTRPSALDSGCISLISSGRDGEASEFIDASESGDDVFFRTAASLVASDPGSYDLYDAREGGGLPVAETPIPCNGDACQPLPSSPEDPTPGTLVGSPGNPPAKVVETGGVHKKHHKKKHHHRGRKHRSRHGKKSAHRRDGSHGKAGSRARK